MDHAKFRQNRSNVCGDHDLAGFFSKCWAHIAMFLVGALFDAAYVKAATQEVATMTFVTLGFGRPTMSVWWSLSLCKNLVEIVGVVSVI